MRGWKIPLILFALLAIALHLGIYLGNEWIIENRGNYNPMADKRPPVEFNHFKVAVFSVSVPLIILLLIKRDSLRK